MCFHEDWKFQFTLANNFCLLEFIWVAKGHLDELQQANKYRGRYIQVSLYYIMGPMVTTRNNLSSWSEVVVGAEVSRIG